MDKNEGEIEVEDTLDLPETLEGEEDTTDWQAEAKKLQAKAIKQRENTKTLKQKLKDKESAIETLAGTKKAEPTKAGELDETQLDYLDLKGINEPDDLKVIESIIKKTGITVREALKDEYVIAKLATNKTQREVKDATPSSTKRGSAGGGNDLAIAIARYEQSGYKELPSDFKLKSAVINAVADKTNPNKPSWH